MFHLSKLLCMIICFILTTKQHILRGQCREKLHTDELTGVERVKKAEGIEAVTFNLNFVLSTEAVLKSPGGTPYSRKHAISCIAEFS